MARTETIEALKEKGDIVECAACGESSAHAWGDVDDQPGSEPDATTVATRGWSKGQVAHVGAADCFGWECGHCGARNTDRDSPTLAEVYTHVDPSTYDQEEDP
jgi:hypothetical protein